MRTFANTDDALAYLLAEVLFGPAAGTCRDATLAGRYAEAGAKIVSYGSITVDSQDQNPGDNFWYDDEGAINALGIGNKGVRAHLDDIVAAKSAVNAHGAQLWVSGSVGHTANIQDYFTLARALHINSAADVAEANYSCGNMRLSDGRYKPTICDDPAEFRESVAAFTEGAGTLKTAAKFGPTTNQHVLEHNVGVCLEHGVRYLIFANTIPNCYLEKPDGTPAISMKRGGLSGPALVPIVTSMLQMAAPLVRGTSTKLIAAGDAGRAQTAYRYLRHGAHGVVYATQLWKQNFDPTVTQSLIFGDESRKLPGLVGLLVQHGLPD